MMTEKQQAEERRTLHELITDLPELTTTAVTAWEQQDLPTFAEAWRKIRNRVYAAQNVFDNGRFGRGKQP
jgi:hypothetical protein